MIVFAWEYPQLEYGIIEKAKGAKTEILMYRGHNVAKS